MKMDCNLNNTCIYRHIRLDTNQVFYIGIGSIKRAFRKYGRNIYWKNITNKTDYEVQILKTNLTWEDACELEKILISYYGKTTNKTGILANMTDGGDGQLGLKKSKETKLKMRNSQLGKNMSDSSKVKMKLAKTNMYFLNENPNAKKVINIETNEIFNTLKEASIHINMKYTTFKWAIKKKLNFNYKYYN